MGGAPAGQQGAVHGPCPETAASEEPSWQIRNGTSYMLGLVGKGQPLTPPGQVGGITAGTSVLMLPMGLLYIWQSGSRQSKKKKQEAKCCIWKTCQAPPEE